MLAMDQMTAHTQLPEIKVPHSMFDNCDITCGSFASKSDESKEGAKEVESPENHQANTGEFHTGGNVHAEAELFQARHLRAKDVMFRLGFGLSNFSTSEIFQTFMIFCFCICLSVSTVPTLHTFANETNWGSKIEDPCPLSDLWQFVEETHDEVWPLLVSNNPNV